MSLALILTCRDFPRDVRIRLLMSSCHDSVAVPARLHSSSFVGFRPGIPQLLLLPVACGGLGHFCNRPISSVPRQSLLMPADERAPCRAQVDQSRLKNSFFFLHNLKRHPTSSSFGLNLANAFGLRMPQIMAPEPSLPPALSCITDEVEQSHLSDLT